MISDLLIRHGITHAFGTRAEEIPETFAERWPLHKPRWKQVHGVALAEVRGPGAPCGEVDALWTRAPGQPIAVVTADCVPVLLARRDGGVVAAVHAGWRGTRARILRELWVTLASAGESPSDWIAAVGPSIGPCCYEVSEELARDFVSHFGDHPAELVSPRHRILDLPALNAAELRAIGLGEVELLRACTRCTHESSGEFAFHSYRREGGRTRQYSMIAAAQTPAPARRATQA
jgi:YfiH family protein